MQSRSFILSVLPLLGLALALPVGVVSTPIPVLAQARSPVAAKLQSILPQLKKQTRVPILLPGELPLPDGSIYVSGTGEPNGYSIDLGFAPDCHGATACSFGFLGARRGTTPYYPESFTKTISLAKGVKGYFRPSRCGASCSPPVLEWVYQQVRYRLELKIGGKNPGDVETKLAQVANSAIQAGPR